MRVEQASDESFDELTANGLVVVAFYMALSGGYKDEQQAASTTSPGAKPRRGSLGRQSGIRRALKTAAWKHNRKIRVVFVEYEQCRDTCHRMGIIGYATFWMLKDGVRLGELKSMVQGGHPKSYAIALDQFSNWFNEVLPAT